MKFVFRSASYGLGLTLIVASAQPIAAVGQTTSQSPPAAVSTASKDNSTATPQQRAIALLDQLARQTNTFGGLNKSLKVPLFQIQVADALWDHDQARARGVFEEAVKSANALLRKRPPGRPLSVNEAQEYEQVCDELIDTALAHDAAFAERLASLTLVPLQADESKEAAFAREYRKQRASLYSQIAKRLAVADPQHAAELLRLSFNDWYGTEQVGALNALRRHAPTLADEIFRNVMAAVRNQPTNVSSKAGILAPYVFPDIANLPAGALARSGDADLQAEVSPALIKGFLESVYDSFMPQPVATLLSGEDEFGFAFFDRYTMQELIPRFERYLPDKAAAFRTRVEEVVARMKQGGWQAGYDSEGEAWTELFRSNVQDWIKKAESAKTQTERDYDYSQAVGVLIYRDGDFEQALTLMNKVGDSDHDKSYLLQTIRRGQIAKAIQDGDAEKAYRYLKGLQPTSQDMDDRPYLLQEIARLLGKTGNAERAKAVLAEARQMVDAQSDRAQDLVRLAGVAAEINPAYGFQIIKEAIVAINASDFSKETSGHSWGDRKIDFAYRHDFDGSLGELARADFNRALELARCIAPKEVALLAQFSVCKGVLKVAAPNK